MEILTEAAETGNIDKLYEVIKADPFILDTIDAIPFADTPLHVASAAGELQFAVEIGRLKPSFSRKVNTDGFLPIHLALQNGRTEMAIKMVRADEEVVRAKGREGVTPLHYAAEKGDLILLAELVLACPESIQDATVRGETALHIAVRRRIVDAVEILVGLLERACYEKASFWEAKILNFKDENGNTALHIAASTNQLQVIELLVKNHRVDINARNSEGLTATDMAEQQSEPDSTTDKIKALLWKVGASPSSSLPPPILISDYVKSQISIPKRLRIMFRRVDTTISADTRNVLLVVAVLIATATYQSALSPPGGVWQDDSTDNLSRPHVAGKTIMRPEKFLLFLFSSTAAFGVSIAVIIVLLPRNSLFWMLCISLLCLSYSYVISIEVISPAEVKDYFYKSLLTYLVILLLADMASGLKNIRRLKRFLVRFRGEAEPNSESSMP